MGTSTEVRIDGACLYAATLAAQWLPHFYKGVTVILSSDAVTLASESHSAPELQSIWHAALANERLFAETAPHRAHALEILAR